MSEEPLSAGTPSVQGHIRELDGLRGIAIAVVLIHHFWPNDGASTRWTEVAHLGWCGVDLFFVISGFLITGILLDTRGQPAYYRNFFARRALRILPLGYGVLSAAFVLLPLYQGGSYSSTGIISESGSPLWYYLFAGNVREAMTGNPPAQIIAPLWSLCIEEQFYFSFPLLVAWISPHRLRALLVCLVLFAPIFRTLTTLIWEGNMRMQYAGTFARFDTIALGALFAVQCRLGTGIPRRRITGLLLLLALAACVVAFCLDGLDRKLFFCRSVGYSLLAGTFVLLLMWTVQNRGTAAVAWLRFPPLVSLGTISYGVYILHRPTEFLLSKGMVRLHLPYDADSFPGMAEKCALSLLLAALSWYFLEKPILRLKRYFVLGNHPSLAGKDAHGPGAARAA